MSKVFKTPVNIDVATGTAPLTVASTTVVTNLNADKLDGQDGSYYIYTHPSGDGNLHVPATGTTNNGKILTAGPTAGSLSWTDALKIAFVLCVVPNSSLCSLTFVAPCNMTIQQVDINCRTINNATQSPNASTNVVLWKNGTSFLTCTNASGISDTTITSSPLPVTIAVGDKLDVRLSAANGLNGLVSATFRGVRS